MPLGIAGATPTATLPLGIDPLGRDIRRQRRHLTAVTGYAEGVTVGIDGSWAEGTTVGIGGFQEGSTWSALGNSWEGAVPRG